MSQTIKYLGIDEAGRGSVLGPLVMGAVVIDEETLETYNKSAITDSKKLTSGKRDELFDSIKSSCSSYSAIQLSPVEIDKAVLSKTSNLNMLELETMVQLISKHIDASAIYIDAISKPDYCTTNLKQLLKADTSISLIKKVQSDMLQMNRLIGDTKSTITLIAQNKADLNYKVVSAASIIAKVTRDREIRKLEEKFNLPNKILASGYPNEQLYPFLKEFKHEIKEKKFPFIRYSWNWDPLKKIISSETKKQSKLVF